MYWHSQNVSDRLDFRPVYGAVIFAYFQWTTSLRHAGLSILRVQPSSAGASSAWEGGGDKAEEEVVEGS